ncbi:hypothetical protein EXE30_01145 [Acinetobacter halotolerans]|uniref:Uncharacterized protein n=1 Tax=Acinetobacter halotolerans TaxID=1752076 RepID=A0A4Q6XJU7_9GAMM|nr:hypothetical protein [Acinetobacter halotolerans]RZF56890.1 hypothetical protein EXE30_01145 [Acinetobacter halotolerans]
MLPTKILKLRLARIAKGKSHLSTQDKLMLVSMDSPDLSANFFLRLFKVSLPKQWKFKHETDEDILYTTQLIQLIENELIPAYEFHARKYAWYEQCVMYQLNYVVQQPTSQQINGYVRQLESCLDQQPKIDLLSYFQQHDPSAAHAIALAKAYAGAGQYSQAIEQYEWAAQHSPQRNEVAFYAYIDCLLHRNQPNYQPDVSDAEYAIALLCQYRQAIDQKTYSKILHNAVSTLLPREILQTRGSETNILMDVGRGLNSLGKSLGGILGGREFQIPYSKEVIASAPQLLTDAVVLESLVQSSSMQHALQRKVTLTKDGIEPQSAESLLINLWRSIQNNVDILTLLLEQEQHEQLIHRLTQPILVDRKKLDLGGIHTILEHGLMHYLGDIRLDKQHAERNSLYEQRDVIVAEMTALAVWFQQGILNSYLQQQSHQLQQIKTLLYSQFDEMALSSGLFAYQFEIQKRVHDLSNWLQRKLEKGNDFDKMQAAWVTLRELSHFDSDEGQDKINQIQQNLEKYKMMRLKQILLDSNQSEILQQKQEEK